MAALPANNTARYFVDYTANGREHTVMFRFRAPSGGGEPTSVFIARVAAFLADVDNYMPTDFTINGARYAAAGSNVTLPATAPSGVTGGQTPAAQSAPAFISFIGRSLGGHKMRVYILGAGVNPATAAGAHDYRLTALEDGTIAAAIANLEGWCALGGTDGLYGIDNLTDSLWHQYANLGFHGHWQRALRG